MILVEPDIRTQFSRRLRLPQLEIFLEQAIRAAKLRGDVSVLLTGDKQIRRWNREFRGKNKPTDVLSFPAAPVEGIDGPMPAPLAGDLAISLETAERQGAEQGHTLLEEIKVLLLHGVLHLAGYDHETDQGQMARVELRLREKLGLKSALIERVHAEMATEKTKRTEQPKKSLAAKASPKTSAPSKASAKKVTQKVKATASVAPKAKVKTKAKAASVRALVSKATKPAQAKASVRATGKMKAARPSSEAPSGLSRAAGRKKLAASARKRPGQRLR